MCPKVTTEHEHEQRARILSAAATCFSRAGVRCTTIQDICDEAGLSKGGLYTYFKAKDEILVAVMEQSLEVSLQRAMTAADTASTPLEKLDRIAVALTEGLVSGEIAPGHSSQLFLEVWAEASKDDRLSVLCARGYAQWRAFLAGLLRQAQDQGQMRADVDADALAAILVSAFDGLSLQEAITKARIDWRLIVQTLRVAIGQGMFTQGSASGGVR